jgi:hypothetical protein
MQFWNDILHTALLGSDKTTVDPARLPPGLKADLPPDQDKETSFLQTAALAFNYRQAGIKPFFKEGLTLSPSATEEKPYCSRVARQLLGELLTENNPLLLRLWLSLCDSKGQLIQPDWLPAILQAGASNKSLRAGIAVCGGKRAEWLAALNPDWKYLAAGNGEEGASQEEIWQTGSAEQRRSVLQGLRRTDPDSAREWLILSWPEEDANSRADLLKQFSIGLSEKDLPFLESLTTDKSKKVREQVVSLLKRMPSSSIGELYAQAVFSHVEIKKTKSLLGGKKTLSWSLPVKMDKAVFSSGINPLSNEKGVSDDICILRQLLEWVPLSLYEERWQLTTKEVLDLFQKDDTGKELFESLLLSVASFSDRTRAAIVLQQATTPPSALIALLPPAQQDQLLIKLFPQSPDLIFQEAMNKPEEWSRELTLLILQRAAQQPYAYNRATFNNAIHLIPLSITEELNKPALSDGIPGNTWSGIREHLARLLYLKQRIINAFNK